MRPINRGNIPQETNENLADRVYTNYQQAKGDLIDRIGDYCVACNRRIPSNLAVEHIYPKKHSPELERDWNNFLLLCTNCNSNKTATNINDNTRSNYYFPHINNTHLAFEYDENGRVNVAEGLNDEQKIKAQSTLTLYGLHKNSGNDSTRSDNRWINRIEAYQAVEDSFRNFLIAIENDCRNEAIDFICIAAKATGFFSLWFKRFKEYPDVRLALIRTFKGTAQDAFDAQGLAIRRNQDEL